MLPLLNALLLLALPVDNDWVVFDNLAAWKGSTGEWKEVGKVMVDPKNPKLLVWDEGKGIFVNGAKGRTRNLVSKQSFGDVEVHLEFLIPKGSNSGIKLIGHYEIQILDSHGVKEPKGQDCGGIYPRAELTPQYHYLDKGTPPRVNACKPPGEWQSLDLIFQAPRFDADGKKTASARFVKVTLNGQLIHENVEQRTPTGHAWHNKEVATGPILIQADHGPVAFRGLKARPLSPNANPAAGLSK